MSSLISSTTTTSENSTKQKAQELTEEKLANVKEAFSLFDRDNDGAIMSREVIAVLRSIGYNPAEKDVKLLLDKYDAEGEGMIEFPVFLEMLHSVKHEGESEEDMEEAFRVFDPTGSGYISAMDLRQAMTNLGEKLTEEEADDMMAYADRTGTGEINYRELLTILLTDGDWK